MSLRACERRALREIETNLCRSDPQLRSMFCMFAALTRDEAASSVEDLGERKARRIARAVRPERLRVIVFISAALAAVMCAVFIAVGGQGATHCRQAGASQPRSPISAARFLPAGHRFVAPASSAPETPGDPTSCSEDGKYRIHR
jgi:hypothetical protein